MAVHKLVLDNFLEEEPFTLIGIHCTLEDYRIAYLLNKHLDIGLVRKKLDLDFKSDKTNYPIFEWNDNKLSTSWNLVSNMCKKDINEHSNMNTLFYMPETITNIYNLIAEHKKVNYLLKIESELNPTKVKYVLSLILQIPQVVTAYTIDINKLKSKNNLIFN